MAIELHIDTAIIPIRFLTVKLQILFKKVNVLQSHYENIINIKNVYYMEFFIPSWAD